MGSKGGPRHGAKPLAKGSGNKPNPASAAVPSKPAPSSGNKAANPKAANPAGHKAANPPNPAVQKGGGESRMGQKEGGAKDAGVRISAAVPPPDADMDYPRGGGSVLTPLEKRQLKRDAEAAAEWDMAVEARGKKRRGAKDDEDEEGLVFAKEALRGRLPKFVELLKFRLLAVGAKALGVIATVTATNISVSLPHGLKGHVALAEASDIVAEMLAREGGAVPVRAAVPSLTEIYTVGQLVRCTIIGLEGGPDDPEEAGKKRKKKIVLSLHVARINSGIAAEALAEGLVLPACVRSVEDHGYMLTLGIRGVTAFLPKTEAGEGRTLRPGQVVDVIVKSAANRRMVQVRASAKAVAGALMKDYEGLTIGALLPGAMVNARVRGVLPDGLLLSFLTYFNGSVDHFHLAEAIPSDKWGAAYPDGTKVRARILYVDPESKRISLTLRPDLLKLEPELDFPPIGTVYKDAVVRRVDAPVGVLLELPGIAKAGYAHVSNTGEGHVTRLDKLYKLGQTVPAKVIGTRPLDALVSLTLRKAEVEQSVASFDQIKAGSVVTGTVASIENFGMFVTLSGSIRALVRPDHLFESGRKRDGAAKYKVGQKVTGRVLTVDPADRKISLTLRRQLLESKLPALACFQDAVVGARGHGVVTGVRDYGVFVRFYGDLKALAPVKELILKPGQLPAHAYVEGQVVKARVISRDEQTRRVVISLKSAGPMTERAAEGSDLLGGLEPGDVVEGTLRAIVKPSEEQPGSPRGGKASGGEHAPYYLVDVTSRGMTVTGRLDLAHLADHPTAQAKLHAQLEALGSGVPLGQLLVLERLEGAAMLRLTRKASMVAAAAQLPRDFDKLKEGALLPGYVASVTADAVFVRFLDKLTGKTGLAQLADTFISAPAARFTPGQSVRCHVVHVDPEKRRFSVSLKSSLTSVRDASFARSLFVDLESAARLMEARPPMEELSQGLPWESVPIGSMQEVTFQGQTAHGRICGLAADENFIGLLTPGQIDGEVEEGGTRRARVLDVNKLLGVVNLTLKPALLEGRSGKGAKKDKAAKALKVGEQVEAVVQQASPDYLVLSIASAGQAIGFAAATSFNLQSAELHPRFAVGQTVTATVAALPDQATGGRLLLDVPLEVNPVPPKREKALRYNGPKIGSIVTGKVTAVHVLHADVELTDDDFGGKIYIGDVVDEADLDSQSPLETLKEGTAVRGVVRALDRGRIPGTGTVYLSIAPGVVKGAESGKKLPLHPIRLGRLEPGTMVQGFVHEVEEGWVWVSLGPHTRGRLHMLEAGTDPTQSNPKPLKERFQPGQPLMCRVVKVDPKKKTLDLSLRPEGEKEEDTTETLKEGAVVSGIVTAVGGHGIRVQLQSGATGNVALTDVSDGLVENILEGLTVGTAVKAALLPPSGGEGEEGGAGRKPRVRLSLRRSRGAGWDGAPQGLDDPAPEGLRLADLAEGQQVAGYIREVGRVGAFVELGRDVVARVRLSNLADGFVEDPVAAFPPGLLVRGRVLTIAPGRVEVTLKAASKTRQLATLSEGDVVRGRVTRIEPYGVFVELEGGGVSGLAHVSELADKFVKRPTDLFQPGQRVRALVLSLDLATNKLGLGLKPSYFKDLGLEDEEEEDADEDAAMQDADLDELQAATSDSDAEESDEDDEADASDADDDADLDAVMEAGDVSASEDGDASDINLLSASDSDEEESGRGAEGDGDGNGVTRGIMAAETRAGAAPSTTGSHKRKAAEDPTTLLGSVGWGDEDDEEKAGTGSTPDGGEAGKPELSRRQAKRARVLKEAEIRASELRRLADPTPQSVADHEKAVLGAPNSGDAWVRYMAFLIQLGEIDGARTIGERALKTIDISLEDEKFEVWVALINLENSYSSNADEAVMTAFNRALPYNDPLKLYNALVDLLEESKKVELARQTLRTMCRKFSTRPDVWLRHISLLLRSGEESAAGGVLDKALTSLDKQDRIMFLRDAALLEYREGSAERGRTLFESIIVNYPKRLDVWSVYLDQEIKQGELGRVRTLFERARQMPLPKNKLKFIYIRYVKFEALYGDANTLAYTKELLQNFLDL